MAVTEGFDSVTRFSDQESSRSALEDRLDVSANGTEGMEGFAVVYVVKQCV